MSKVSFVAPVLVAFAVVAGCSSAGPEDPSESTESALRDNPELNNPLPRHALTGERFVHEMAHGGGSGNLSYHGGAIIPTAHLVAIFWGSSWSTSDPVSTTLSKYVASYGTTGEYNVITQYTNGAGQHVTTTNLAADNPAVWYDSSNPPTNVTDAAVQGEVSKFLAGHSFDASAIYEVFLPSGSYSSDGSSTSCGGPNLSYCAYHGNFSASVGNVKYASMPYPSCGGCQSAGFSDAQNIEHFISHETREAVTDADGTAWYDRRGYEADDKCAWSPAPFVDSATGFAYQYEWSNAVSGCVKSK